MSDSPQDQTSASTGARVGIVTDSSCDLPAELVERWGIEVVPLSIRFGEEEFIDREELSTDEFWARCAKSPVLPSGAAGALRTPILVMRSDV